MISLGLEGHEKKYIYKIQKEILKAIQQNAYLGTSHTHTEYAKYNIQFFSVDHFLSFFTTTGKTPLGKLCLRG